MRILVIGDIHGRYTELARLLHQAQLDYRIGAAIQVGDFGFAAEAWGRPQVRFPVPVHVIDGNHEDHRWLRLQIRRGIPDQWAADCNLIYQPRPSCATIGGTTVGFLGGALHVDRPQRHSLLNGWANYVLRHQRERAARLFNQRQPELLVTHSCPAGIGIGMRGAPEFQPGVEQHIRTAGFDPGPSQDCGEPELERLWRDLQYRPRAWVFGHFHVSRQVRLAETQFACVGNEWGDPRQRLTLWDSAENRLLQVPVDPSAP